MSKKKVLLVHVPYQVRGGEDIHVQMLASAYAEIGVITVCLPESREPPRSLGIQAAASLLPGDHSAEFERALGEHRPDLIHLHNIFPTLGPRFLRRLKTAGLPVVMTVHNHRFFCTNGLALRDGKSCKLCFHSTVPWKSLVHNCNRDWKRTAYYTAALGEIRAANLLEEAVDRFIAPSPYIQGALERFGIPTGKIRHILHPTVNPPPATRANPEFDVIYAGRLSHEKGIAVLLDAIERLPDIRFAIVGDGPEEASVRLAAKRAPQLAYFPQRTHHEALALIAKSRIGVLPSICNEILSLFALEVFFQGKRCVVSDSDSMRWFEGGSFPGCLAKTGDAADLARAIRATLALPELSAAESARIRDQLGMRRFCGELRALVDELCE